jgi:hypothetical protein
MNGGCFPILGEYPPFSIGAKMEQPEEDIEALWQKMCSEHIQPNRLFKFALGLDILLPEDAIHFDQDHRIDQMLDIIEVEPMSYVAAEEIVKDVIQTDEEQKKQAGY